MRRLRLLRSDLDFPHMHGAGLYQQCDVSAGALARARDAGERRPVEGKADDGRLELVNAGPVTLLLDTEKRF